MNYIDVKYVGLLCSTYPMFKQTRQNLWNFRCPICGDSKKSKTKARGFIFVKENSMLYRCHNCGESTTFKKFMQERNPVLYKEYIVEKYKNRRQDTTKVKKETGLTFSKPKTNVLSECTQLYRLPKDHMCREYVKNRGISYRHFRDLYYIDDINILTSKLPEYKNNKFAKSAKLVIPFINEKGKLTHIQLRSVDGKGIRYITLTLDDDAPKVYGLDRIQFDKQIRVVEGPIDSLFVFNCIASGGIDLVNLLGYNDDMVFIFDKQPRNPEVVKHIEKAIATGAKICLLPDSLKGKDINDFVLNGIDMETVIRENTTKGLKAKLAFSKWKKV